ncbi:MAG: peptide deformylase [Phycisphaerae bacterium]|nr:peptide deformylase [Phycisphaerae bacterium]
MSAAPRRIVLFPAAVLRRRAAEVTRFDDSLRGLVDEMVRVMREQEGAGLAAPQVGESLRVFVTEARPEEGEALGVHVNPVIEISGDETDLMNEGCLSLPEIRGDIRRPAAVTITSSDLEGRRHARTSDGMIARIWQHEFDHLEGVLIVDRMAPVDRMRARKSLRALERSAGA